MSVSFTTTPKQKGNLYLASSLCDGVEDNDLKQVTTLLTKKDADPNVLMPLHGITPFHLVIGNDSEAFAEEVTKLFLRHGGNPNVRSVDGMTPVHVAAAWGRTTILDLLLANGGDPLYLDNDYCSPIHYAFQGEHHDAVHILTKYCTNDEEEDEKPKFKRELEKILVNNGDVLAEYILSNDSIYSSTTDSSFIRSRSSNINTSDYMPESSTTNSMSINNKFITLRKEKKETRKNKFDLKKETDEEERILINKIIAQLSSTITSDIDSSTSIFQEYESEYSSNEVSPPKHKRISMTFNRPKRNNEFTKLKEKSTNNNRSSTLQVIKQHNHVSYLNNEVLKNNLKKIPNISEKNNLTKKSMQSLTKKHVTPNKFETSTLTQDNLSYTNKWLDETIISRSPNLVVDTLLHEKKSKMTNTLLEKRSSPTFVKISKRSPLVTPTKGRSPQTFNKCVTPVNQISKSKKYFTTPSHLKTVKRNLKNSTKTVVYISNKRKVNSSERISTSKISNTKVPLNHMNNQTIFKGNSTCSRSQDIDCKKLSFKKVAMNLNDCKYDDEEDLINERINNVTTNSIENKLNGCLPFDINEEYEKQLPRSHYVSGIGMLESGITSRSNSKSDSDKENSLSNNSQIIEAIIEKNTAGTLPKNESRKEKINEEREISQHFEKPADAYGSPTSTIGSSLSVSSDSYQSLPKRDHITVDNADNDKNVDLESPLFLSNNSIFKDSKIKTSPKHELDTFLNIEEEYKYEDPEEGINFLERRLCVSPPCASSDMNSSYYSCSTAKSEPLPKELLMLDNITLRERLQNLGDNPGPITETTHRLYLKRLHKLESTSKKSIHQNHALCIQSKKLTDFNTENDNLKSSLLSIEWIQNLDDYEANEQKIFLEFHNPNPSRKWREGTTKCSFNYLLLDPRITEDLPRRANTLSMSNKWKTFLSAIFYVGKGKQSRPYAHLYDAFKIWVSKNQHDTSEKIQRILDIWNDGRGVVVLHVFHNTIPAEAYTREAAMIEALGTKKLGNCKCGDYYGVVATWRLKEKCELGRYLLFKAFQILLVEGERQIFPDNL
ncbi:uncharacterized protein LOC131671883 [Phymastichus coffea]|uniref:uncharacterized protein LOC131671883 n=1 Tax=Phymastichus coffea TaxID=108790 RepID=UPI00273B4837|nr:uncharacterized protein LOC131671883 [Phymastichus coffea]